MVFLDTIVDIQRYSKCLNYWFIFIPTIGYERSQSSCRLEGEIPDTGRYRLWSIPWAHNTEKGKLKLFWSLKSHNNIGGAPGTDPGHTGEITCHSCSGNTWGCPVKRKFVEIRVPLCDLSDSDLGTNH